MRSLIRLSCDAILFLGSSCHVVFTGSVWPAAVLYMTVKPPCLSVLLLFSARGCMVYYVTSLYITLPVCFLTYRAWWRCVRMVLGAGFVMTVLYSHGGGVCVGICAGTWAMTSCPASTSPRCCRSRTCTLHRVPCAPCACALCVVFSVCLEPCDPCAMYLVLRVLRTRWSVSHCPCLMVRALCLF